MDQTIKHVIDKADGILILAGAGMSVESGLPDFRGTSGLWTQAKQDFITHATASGFKTDPVKAWNFYVSRIHAYGDTPPHAGYGQLLQLLHRLNKPWFVVTTNVDQAFHKSGYAPDQIHELHGGLHHMQCATPCGRHLVPMRVPDTLYKSASELPTCDDCGAIMRPNVMMFSDPHLVWRHIDEGAARYSSWCAQLLNVVAIEIGAGTGIPSLRIFGEERSAMCIRINPHEWETHRPQDVGLMLTAQQGIQYISKLFM